MSEYIVEAQYDGASLAIVPSFKEEIVRCRDCANYEYREHLKRSYCCGEYATEPDGFCAWAVKRTGAENG